MEENAKKKMFLQY